MSYLSALLSLVAILVGLYYYYSKKDNIFKKHGILHIPPVPLLGNMGKLLTKQLTMHDLVKRSYDLHPEAKYVGFFEFQVPVIVIRDVNLIKSIAMKNFEHFIDHRPLVNKDVEPLFGRMLFVETGNRWKEQRSLLSPIFSTSKIRNMFQLMNECAMNFANGVLKLSDKERDVEMKAMISKYTNDVIASCAYGIALDSFKEPKNIFYVYGRTATSFTGFVKMVKLLIHRNLPEIARFFNIKVLEEHATKFFVDQVNEVVKTRDEKQIYRPDMMQLMMDNRVRKDGSTGLTMSDIACHAFTFFFGGFDSVSTQVSFVFRLLIDHPDIQARLQEEIDETLEKSNGELSYDIINQMQYLDAVINETLRLYPIVVFLDRLCVDSFELPPPLPGEKPFTVKPGMNVWFPVTAIQRDPKYYDNPDKFDPERFLNDTKSIVNSGTYMPFGLGPRMCIGNRFALMEMKTVIFHLLSKCDLKVCKKTVVPLQMQEGTLNLTAKGGYWMKIDPRKHVFTPFRSNGVVNGAINGISKNVN